MEFITYSDRDREVIYKFPKMWVITKFKAQRHKVTWEYKREKYIPKIN